MTSRDCMLELSAKGKMLLLACQQPLLIEGRNTIHFSSLLRHVMNYPKGQQVCRTK
jgi:hypothetical protein